MLKIEKRFAVDGVPYDVMVITHGGAKYELEDGCDEEGRDSEAETPWGFKLVETSYKNMTDGELIVKIQKLANHPDATYEEFRDEDGDMVWRVFFKTPEAS